MSSLLGSHTWSGCAARAGLTVDGQPGISCGPGAPNLFARGLDQAVWTRTLTGSWKILGGAFVGDPAATGRARDIDVIAQGQDFKRYRDTRDGLGHWSGWSPIQ
jgi:hypothetical protein